MKTLRNYLFAALVLAVLALSLYVKYQWDQLDELEREKEGVIADAILKEAGWVEAGRLKEQELTSLRESLAASRRSSSTPIVRLSSRTNSTSLSIPMPKGCSVNPPLVGLPLDSVTKPSLDPLVDPQPSLNLSLANEVELAIDRSPSRELFVLGKVHTYVESEDWASRGTTDIVDAKISLGSSLTEALDFYDSRPSKVAITPRRMKHWRLGWTVGMGVVDPLEDPKLGAFVGYGVAF